ncbi:N,N'-diacetylchitobiose phosphorylase [Xylanibacillus composti]|uniref:N,N'-diacetylchitobiose phosphorylase n=2 Tax=Xylanibacillus composti TaxID=1572762 RepID=A0A8J4M287_9BACL|nr:N,N'-diacetylchitobiose phosphorylase [Xylanibacillus composti]MDT9724214.1 N,N'-diacetylchitobiose phosphorylase [Xylanibacillus composti]GIQ68271.1 N,N'-diacetylchitobiose phosphorylase [Xylanibacillus composti]
MKYGYFDGDNKEYVITKPNTPAPWANYLGSPEYGAIISNNAGGYSFVKSGANGRIIRYRFNSTPADQPGRYIYIRDREMADYWSASWQPVGKDLSEYESECRHGTAYTAMKSKYKGIETDTLYYVPLDKTYEVWRLKVTNQDERPRKLSLFGYVEFTNDANYEQDTVNLQYTQFISKTYFRENMILQAINEHVSEVGGGASGLSDEAGEGIWRFFGVQGAEVNRYDGDRDIFVGDYRGYQNPASVEQGACTNTLNYNGNSCGALQIDVELAPGETKEIVFLLGAYGEADARQILGRYETLTVVEEELQELKSYWHSKLDRFQVQTPDDNFNQMVNVWNAYQCFITFIWSRAASFQYCGLRNGLGYRDTVQDIQGIMHLEPELARERLTLMLSAQVSNGGGLPLVKFDHRPGHEGTPDDPDYARETGHPFYRADDALWLFPTTIRYLKESGNWAYVDEVIPFSDQGEGTVYEHLRRAIQFSIDRLGEHGMPVGLHADWNDALRLGAHGESLFVAFQLYLALGVYKEIAAHKQDDAQVHWAEQLRAALGDNIQKHAWEGDRFVRGFTEDGYVVGSRENEEASLWLNPQTWSILSGFAEPEQARTAMDLVYEQLNTEYGAMLFYPPFKKFGLPVARMALFNGTTKENAGIFSQPQGWLIQAETMLGRGNRAYQYFTEINPAAMNDKAEIRKIEPYVHGQSIEGIDSPFFGRGHVHWLTGTASTVMVSLAEGIMGVQPTFDGLRLDPCIPSTWSEFSMYREFRSKRLRIKVENPNHVEKGVAKVMLNGEELEGNLLPDDRLRENNDVLVLMG